MLKFKNNRYLLLLQDEFRRIVTEEHPELIKDSETLTKIDITKDRLSRYLSSKDEEISIEIRTALNLCNYLNVPPYAIFATDGHLTHPVDDISHEKVQSQTMTMFSGSGQSKLPCSGCMIIGHLSAWSSPLIILCPE